MDATIRVNNTKETELDFDVNIQGISIDAPENAAKVRFVITNVHGGNLSFDCEMRADDSTKWYVKLPPLPQLSSTTNAHAFRMEVIIDGYYFEPASGNLILLKDPEITMSKPAKPKVSVSAAPVEKAEEKGAENKDKEGPKADEKKEDDKEKKEEDKKGEKVDEYASYAAGNGLGQGTPTNKLLVPEFEPGTDIEGDDPEHEGKPRRQPEDIAADEFVLFHRPKSDPAAVAEAIIKETIGKTRKPAKPGFLFNRSGGKAVVEGVEPDAETKQTLKKKADAVKAALRK